MNTNCFVPVVDDVDDVDVVDKVDSLQIDEFDIVSLRTGAPGVFVPALFEYAPAGVCFAGMASGAVGGFSQDAVQQPAEMV
jgi:hypothetical protein